MFHFNKPLFFFSLLFSLNLLFANTKLQAQNTNHGGWLFLSHTQKLSPKFDLLADIQMRTGNQFKNFNTLLLRTAVNYNINDTHALALGYANKNDWEKEDAVESHTLEHRIYEQYTLNFNAERIEFTLRSRFEQRFVKEERFVFSQRLRAFVSAQIPLLANDEFTKGWYAKLQNEVFLNVHQKEKVNGSLLDQNRPYAGFGYRINKKADIELGYTRWLQREEDGDATTNVAQLMITTSF